MIHTILKLRSRNHGCTELSSNKCDMCISNFERSKFLLYVEVFRTPAVRCSTMLIERQLCAKEQGLQRAS